MAVSGGERSDAVAARRRVDGSVGDGEVAGPAERDEGDAIQSRQTSVSVRSSRRSDDSK